MRLKKKQKDAYLDLSGIETLKSIREYEQAKLACESLIVSHPHNKPLKALYKRILLLQKLQN